MGSRADFYVGRGKKAEWLGSIAWDGYPEGIRKPILRAKTEAAFRKAVGRELRDREDGTSPESGWPWPWENSQTTDYAYSFARGKVSGSCFGSRWFDPLAKLSEDGCWGGDGPLGVTVFPNMEGRRALAEPGSAQSGVIVVSVRR